MAAGTATSSNESIKVRPPLEPDLGLACEFALRWASEVFVFVTIASIFPAGAPRAQTWHAQQDQPRLRRWLASKSGRENLYFTVNAPAKETLKAKPKKADIGLLCAVWGDLDPHPDVEAEPGGWQLERGRLLALAAELAELPWPPTVIIDSGNGIAPLWQLEAVLPNVEEHQGAIEALGRRIEKALGGIENTSNIDRLLRLPGTINLPDAKKLGKGRGPTLSYETAVAKGDLRFGDFLEMHHAAVRAELARYRGEEVNTAGDGFVAAFDGPARAIRCALAIRSALDAAGIACRIGLHTGECGVRHGDLVGIALHIAARVAESAPPGAVLVSQTVKDLVAGSGLNFKDAGVHRLKGLPDEWHLYDVVSR